MKRPLAATTEVDSEVDSAPSLPTDGDRSDLTRRKAEAISERTEIRVEKRRQSPEWTFY